jgi:hypothetical protein
VIVFYELRRKVIGQFIVIRQSINCTSLFRKECWLAGGGYESMKKGLKIGSLVAQQTRLRF